MKQIREYLTELEKINNDIINLKFYQAKTYQTLIDRIMLDCRTEIHPDVMAHLNKTKRLNKIGYWVHDIERKVFMATRELLQFLGRDTKRDSFSEDEFFAALHPDDLERIASSYAQDILAHQERASAYRMVTPQLEVKFVVSHFSIKYDKDDNPIQVTGVIFEIPQTDKDNSNYYTEAKNEIISANMGVGFWEYDAKTNTEYWSSSLYDIIEASPEEYPPDITTLEKFIIKDQLPESLDFISQENSKNIDYEITMKIKTKTGKEKLIFSQVHHLVNNDGVLIKRYGLIYDISKMKQLLI